MTTNGMIGDKLARVATACAQVRDALTRASRHALPAIAAAAAESLATLEILTARLHRKFQLGVVGETRAGKSTLVNVIVSDDLVPQDIDETTATLNRIVRGSDGLATIVRKDGSQERLSNVEARELLLARREDVAWLSEIDEVTFQSPAGFLEFIDLWDIPGIGGSPLPDVLAHRFLENTDAVLWVFNGLSLAKQELDRGLAMLGARGKTIIGVINQLDGHPIELHAEAEREIERCYEDVAFQGMLLTSALKARHLQQGRRGVNARFAGTPFADAGLRALQDTIASLVARSGDLKAAAVAGDVRALVQSVSDRLHYQYVRNQRHLWLYASETAAFRQQLDATLDAFETEVIRGLFDQVSSELRAAMNARLEAATRTQLAAKPWLSRQFDEVVNAETIRAICERYLESKRDELRAQLRKLTDEQVDRLVAKLAVPEIITADLSKLRTSDQLPVATDELWNRLRAPLVAGLTGLFVAGVGGALAGFIVAAAIDALGDDSKGSPLFDDARLRGIRRGEAARCIEESLASQRPRLAANVREALKAHKQTMLALSDDRLGAFLFTDRSRMQVSEDQTELHAMARSLDALAAALVRDAGLPISRIHQVERRFAAGATADVRKVLDAIFAEARVHGTLCITDGLLDAAALTQLVRVDASTPIRLLTWHDPLDPLLCGVFRQKLAEVDQERRRNAKPGGGEARTTVLVAKRENQKPPDLFPTGCWIFTGAGCYHFDASLRAVVDVKAPVAFKPYPLDRGQVEVTFERWWRNDVAGYQVIPPEVWTSFLPALEPPAAKVTILPTVAGMDDLKQSLLEQVIEPFRDPDRFARYNIKPPNGILLYGPPGCGKTYIAEALGKDLGMTYRRYVASDFGDPYAHQTAKKIAAAFEKAAREKPALLFLDECDAVLEKRSASSYSHTREEVSEFLNQMNNCGDRGILVVAATNLAANIDDAALRPGRFDSLVYVGLPDLESRVALIEMYLPDARDRTLDVRALAGRMDRYTAAEVRAVIDAAKTAAARQRADVSERHVADALETIRPSITRAKEAEYKSIGSRGQRARPAMSEAALAEVWQQIVLDPEVKRTLLAMIQLFNTGSKAAPKGLLLHGPSGTGKTEIARLLARSTGSEFFSTGLAQLKGSGLGESTQKVAALWDKARMAGRAVIFIDECDGVFARRGGLNSDQLVEEMVNVFLTSWDGVDSTGQIWVVGATNKRERLDDAIESRFGESLKIDLPGAAERLQILTLELCKLDAPLDVPASMARATQGFSGRTLGKLAAAVVRHRSRGECVTEDAWLSTAAKFATSGSDAVEAQAGWSSLILPEAVMKRLRQFCGLLKSAETLRAQGHEPPRAALLYGPPGTGKTEIARTMANESGLAFIAATPADLKAGYLGQSGRLVKELFERARAKPTVLFLDEIDVSAPGRASERADQYTREIVAELLTELDGAAKRSGTIFVLAATNHPSLIDDAVVSRFHERIEIGLPGTEERRRMLVTFIGQRRLDTDLDQLARRVAAQTDGLSGRDLRALVERASGAAAERAVDEGTPDQIVIRADDWCQLVSGAS